MITLLILAYACTWLFTEAKYATMGKPSPRMQLKMQREQRGQYSLGMWASDFVGDFLKDMTAKRRELKAERVEQRREDRDRRKRAAVELDAAIGQAVALTAPVVPRWPVVTSAKKVSPERPIAMSKSPGPDAQVISLTARKHEKESSSVSYDEGQFLTASIQHCKAVAAAHHSHTEGGAGEDFVTGLESAGVKGAQLAAVHAALEASASAAAAWDEAAQKLGEGLQVKEAYESSPDTGDKAYVTGGE